MFGKLEASDIALINAYMAQNDQEAIYLKYPVAQFTQGVLQGVLYGYIKEQSLIGLFYFSNKRSLILHFSDSVVLSNMMVLKAFKHHKPRYIKGTVGNMRAFYQVICRSLSNVHEDESLLMSYEGEMPKAISPQGYERINSVREAESMIAQDLKFIMRVEQHFGRTVQSVQDIQRNLEGLISQGQYCLIKHDGTLVAQGLIEEETEHIGIIGGLYVLPQHRGFGVGRYISEHLTAQLMAQAKQALLFVLVKNEAAIALYERIGYVPVCRFSIYTVDY